MNVVGFDTFKKASSAQRSEMYYKSVMENELIKDLGMSLDELLDLLNMNAPDVIKITHEQDMRISDIWKRTKENDNAPGVIPSDLFFSNTIPLKDCCIEIDERNSKDLSFGMLVKYRVYIVNDIQKRIEQLSNGESKCIGCICETAYDRNDIGILCPIAVTKGVNGIGFSQGCIAMGGDLKTRSIMNYMLNADTKKCMEHFHSLMTTWYSIEISLLCPEIRVIYNSPVMNKNKKYIKATNSERKRIVKYIKTYYLRDDELDKAIYGNTENKRNRHCLVWYVIGHWRTYKDGKQVFIQGYWKGVLRELKHNLDNRERVIE